MISWILFLYLIIRNCRLGGHSSYGYSTSLRFWFSMPIIEEKCELHVNRLRERRKVRVNHRNKMIYLFGKCYCYIVVLFLYIIHLIKYSCLFSTMHNATYQMLWMSKTTKNVGSTISNIVRSLNIAWLKFVRVLN